MRLSDSRVKPILSAWLFFPYNRLFKKTFQENNADNKNRQKNGGGFYIFFEKSSLKSKNVAKGNQGDGPNKSGWYAIAE